MQQTALDRQGFGFGRTLVRWRGPWVRFLAGHFSRGSFARYNEFVSTARVMKGGRVKRTQVPRGPNGRGLCRWCGLEVPPRRFTFCSAGCVHEWKLRSQPAYLRAAVLLRDKGRCGGCGVDTLLELRRLKRSRGSRRLELMAHWGLKTKLRSLWDADHITPVVEGGGECDLLNLRTLQRRRFANACAAPKSKPCCWPNARHRRSFVSAN